MPRNVTSKVTKSAGTATPEPTENTAKSGRTPIAPEQRTVTVRGAQRRYLAILLNALDGDKSAIATLFDGAAPVAPTKPVLSESDKTNPDALLAHIASLDAYSAAVEQHATDMEVFATSNVARNNIRTAVWNSLNDIPLRARKSKSESESEPETAS